jgi:chromosomal replication initiator protein
MQTLVRWISVPENQAARLAVERVADAVCARLPQRDHNPLFLHGPSGTGKTHLMGSLASLVTERAPDRLVCLLTAGDFLETGKDEQSASSPSPLSAETRQADLLVVEDLQHLPARAVETLVQLADRGLARGQQQVFTATEGPAQLSHLPSRLTSRLSGGLVVGLLPLGPDSRLVFLREQARRLGLNVSADALTWLAEHVPGSGRQLEGAIARLQALSRLAGDSLDLDTLASHFQVEAEAGRPTVERIVQRVGRYFQVEPRQLQSRHRTRSVLLPRQVGMYLARQLTGLSLGQIGAYFGGRDHSTVLHACRKVEQALARDAHLSGAVRQLHADLA